jgi:hypothetical protein
LVIPVVRGSLSPSVGEWVGVRGSLGGLDLLTPTNRN